MGFQSTVRLNQTTGMVGDLAFDGAQRAEPNSIDSADPLNNVIGRAFTAIAGIDGYVEAGGLGAFAGILVNPLVYANNGVAGNALAPTIVLPNQAMAEFLKMGTIVVELLNAGNIGDNVEFDQATGELYAIAGTTPTVGRSLVPNTKVVRQNVPAAGLAFIQLTN